MKVDRALMVVAACAAVAAIAVRVASRDFKPTGATIPEAGPPDPETERLTRQFFAVALDGPSEGPKDAAVKIVMFESVRCPECERARATFTAMQQRFPDHVSVAYRRFLRKGSTTADTLTEAAVYCASESGVGPAAFGKALPSGKIRDWMAIGARLGVRNSANFSRCAGEGVNRARIARESAQGDSMGIATAPAAYINAKAFPLTATAEQIDNLMARLLDRQRTGR